MKKCLKCNSTGKLPDIYIQRDFSSDAFSGNYTHHGYFQIYNETCPECFGSGIINLNTMIKHLHPNDIKKGINAITRG